MSGMFDRMVPTAFTLVLADYRPTELAPEKWVGGWVHLEPEVAEKCRKYLPECVGPTEVREVELAGPLEQVAVEDKDRPGVWVLTKPAKILPEVIREAADRPQSKAKAKKGRKASAKPSAPCPDTGEAPPAS